MDIFSNMVNVRIFRRKAASKSIIGIFTLVLLFVPVISYAAYEVWNVDFNDFTNGNVNNQNDFTGTGGTVVLDSTFHVKSLSLVGVFSVTYDPGLNLENDNDRVCFSTVWKAAGAGTDSYFELIAHNLEPIAKLTFVSSQLFLNGGFFAQVSANRPYQICFTIDEANQLVKGSITGTTQSQEYVPWRSKEADKFESITMAGSANSNMNLDRIYYHQSEKIRTNIQKNFEVKAMLLTASIFLFIMVMRLTLKLFKS